MLHRMFHHSEIKFHHLRRNVQQKNKNRVKGEKMKNIVSFVSGVILGAAVAGAAVALTTPKRGEELRDELRGKTTEIKDKAIEVKESMLSKSTEWKDVATAKSSEIKDVATAKTAEWKDVATVKVNEVRDKFTSEPTDVNTFVSETVEEILD